jgi:hypothetical protein
MPPRRLTSGWNHLHRVRPIGRAEAMIDRSEEGCEGPLRPDRGSTSSEESVVPFGGGTYEIRIKGRLSDSVLAAFMGMRASVKPVETVLHGPVQDQSSLHDLLSRIQSLGLELIEIRRLPPSADEAPAEPEHQPPDF